MAKIIMENKIMLDTTEWIEIVKVIGDTGPKGDTGDIGIGTVRKGHYDTYEEFIRVHPSGRLGDAYIVDGSYYYWNETGWANAGSIKGKKETLVIKVLKAILVRKAVKEIKVILEKLDKKEKKDPKAILEIQELLELLDQLGQKGTLELLALALLLKVRIILMRN